MRSHDGEFGGHVGVASKTRWGRTLRRLALALIVPAAILGLAACGSSSTSSSSTSSNKTESSLGTVLYGTLPPAGTPVSGGTITQGQLTGQTPTYIFPIAPGAQTVDRHDLAPELAVHAALRRARRARGRRSTTRSAPPTSRSSRTATRP